MIYYVMYYTEPTDKKRGRNLAAVSMADYIIDCFQSLCGRVTILSNSKPILGIKLKTETKKIRKGVVLHTFDSFKIGNPVINKVNTIYGLAQLFFFVVVKAKKGDVVCVYHSMGYRSLFSLIKKFRKDIFYILEINELYQYVDINTSDFKKKENTVFKSADAFICTNDYMEKQINRADSGQMKKPSAVISGIYKSFPEKKVRNNMQGKVLVYAGSFERQKGVDLVLEMASYLNPSYEVKIVGFGEKEDIDRVEDKIKRLVKQGHKVKYDGLYKGENLNSYLQNCDIGLCFQYVDDELNYYEFPSKILLYMANHLNVITNDLPQVKGSPVGKYLNVFNTNDLKEIAQRINDGNYRNFDVKKGLKELDIRFRKDLKNLLNQRKYI